MTTPIDWPVLGGSTYGDLVNYTLDLQNAAAECSDRLTQIRRWQ